MLSDSVPSIWWRFEERAHEEWRKVEVVLQETPILSHRKIVSSFVLYGLMLKTEKAFDDNE